MVNDKIATTKQSRIESPPLQNWSKKEYTAIILILGSLTTISPFSIDMYLPSFPEMAKDLNASVSSIQLSLTSYFIGIAFGQLIYGPVLDRFGRKLPLYIGMAIYIASSVACVFTYSSEFLIVVRLFQALGGCASMVAARAFVRDLFPVNETAKIFSTLMLVIAVSPMVAPTLGSYVTVLLGWRFVFIILAVIGTLITLGILTLPTGKAPDPEFSLRPGQLAKNYLYILKQRNFYIYAFIGGISSASLFAYVSASSDVFINLYHVSKTQYGWIFAIIASGLIGSAQVNRLALNRLPIEKIIVLALCWQLTVGTLLIVGSSLGWFDAIGMTILIFAFLCGFGFINPNAAALSLAPFYREAGSASALMGAIQMTMGVLASVIVSIWHNDTAIPMATVMLSSAVISLGVVYVSKKSS